MSLFYWQVCGDVFASHKRFSRLTNMLILVAAFLSFFALIFNHQPARFFLVAAAICIGFGIRGWIKMLPLAKGARQASSTKDVNPDVFPVCEMPTSKPVALTSKVVFGQLPDDIVRKVAPKYAPPGLTEEELKEKSRKTAVRRIVTDTYAFTPFMLVIGVLTVLSVTRLVWV